MVRIVDDDAVGAADGLAAAVAVAAEKVAVADAVAEAVAEAVDRKPLTHDLSITPPLPPMPRLLLAPAAPPPMVDIEPLHCARVVFTSDDPPPPADPPMLASVPLLPPKP